MAEYNHLKINWIPDGCMVDYTEQDNGVYCFLRNNVFAASIVYQPISQQTSVDMHVDTEDSVTTYLDLPGFTDTMLIEMSDAIVIISTTEKEMFMLTSIDCGDYFMTTGELLQILQNIEY